MYPTDLSDSQWKVIEQILNDQRKRKYNLRSILNAIFYLCRSGCQWRMLPKEYPPYNSCFYYYRKWKRDGTWVKLNTALNRHIRKASGREADPSVGIIDSQSIKNSERGVVDKGFDGNKKIKGRKRQLVVDTLGLILAVAVHPANMNDGYASPAVFRALAQMGYTRLRTILADSAYRGRLEQWGQILWGWTLQIVSKPKKTKSFQVIPMRWKVERTISWLMWFRRLSRDFECELDSSETQLYIANIYRCAKKI